ncbi:unnamed protein product (macronuclear) [Paramecium tetraurelia]|uniref:Uncharacterized protein n=1 Tax=Paramecium tetraurelia TaxID=5888 RepID=A0CJX4_PARTE|nr:uncharacterized protein GSPATT00000803001 [Paramecium tetraurelia]CAK71091.1 unnamed protein product [Paramecium tetraurelia]|eukprot:XP_001438488.1 hypothetical protein (macronuclear) [Paramecium tetraurelia strain d4-2]
MNLYLLQQSQNYRQKIHNKFKSKQFMAQTIFKLASQQNKKNNINLATQKQVLGKQNPNREHQFQVMLDKFTLDFQGSPLKSIVVLNQSPNVEMRNEFNSSKFISTMRSMSQFRQSMQQQNFNPKKKIMVL